MTKNLGPKKMADGGVVSSQPSKLSGIWDFLFGNKALKQAGQTGSPPPSAPPQPDQDVSYIRKAAQEAAERLKKAKEVSPDKTPKEFKCGGVVKPGSYGRR